MQSRLLLTNSFFSGGVFGFTLSATWAAQTSVAMKTEKKGTPGMVASMAARPPCSRCDFHSGFACGLDGGDGGASGGADVVDDNDAGTF